MVSLPFDPYLLMHAAALLSFAALAFRDQLKLRAVLLVSIALNTLYHLSRNPGPAWQEVFWNVVTFAITLKVLAQLVLDRTHIGLTAEEEELFSAFNSLTPGEFRALVKVGVWKTAEAAAVLTTEGALPDHLFFVLRGTIAIEKAGRRFTAPPRTFIGEVAFLHRTPASATVTLEPGGRYMEWPAGILQSKIGSRHSLNTSISRLIGLDMALKIARS